VGETLSVSFKFAQLEVSRSLYPHSACHNEQAWRGVASRGNRDYNIGKVQPKVLTYIGPSPDPNPPPGSIEAQARAADPNLMWDKKARRARSTGRILLPDGTRNYTDPPGVLDSRGKAYGTDLDEYPPASFRENAVIANIKRINSEDNQDSGNAWGGVLYNTLRAGTGDLVEFVTVGTYPNGFSCRP
jgi:hypothetical protein